MKEPNFFIIGAPKCGTTALSEYLRTHPQTVRQGGQQIPKRCGNPRVLQYKQIGSLGSQMEKLLSLFPKNQVKAIVFDDFKASPQTVYEEALAFLGVPSDNRVDFPRINASKTHNLPWLGRFTEKTPTPILALAKKTQSGLGIESFGVMNVLRNLNAKLQARQPLAAEFRGRLIEEFRDETHKLSQVLHRDLSHWMSEQ